MHEVIESLITQLEVAPVSRPENPQEIHEDAEFAGTDVLSTTADSTGDIVVPDDADYRDFMNASSGGFFGNRYFHILGTEGEAGRSVFEWNTHTLWKWAFGGLENFFVIAEDFLGNQYGYRKVKNGSRICMLSIIDGEFYRAPDSFIDFVKYQVFEQPYAEADLFESWGALNGEFPLDAHLSFCIHPLLGGLQEDLDNMETTDRLQHLRFTGQLITQIRELPAGTVIRDVEVEGGRLTLVPE